MHCALLHYCRSRRRRVECEEASLFSKKENQSKIGVQIWNSLEVQLTKYRVSQQVLNENLKFVKLKGDLHCLECKQTFTIFSYFTVPELVGTPCNKSSHFHFTQKDLVIIFHLTEKISENVGKN